MLSLADELELMNDFESDEGEEDVEMEVEVGVKKEDDDEEEVEVDSSLLSRGIKQVELLDANSVERMSLSAVTSVDKVAKLYNSKLLKEVLIKVDHYRLNPDPNLASDGDSQEYQLIVQANNLSVEIDNEMLIVHKFIRDHYTPRFPELESLVSDPFAFCRVVIALGNDEDMSRGKIEGLITSGAVMAVKVTAATSKGVQLDDREWGVVTGACTMMFDLDTVKKTILSYVESRISLLAPNISAIVGTSTATKILGIAGGLQALSRIPHSNIYVLGAAKKASTGFSTASHSVDRLHTGFIYQCPLVQATRPEDRMKAQRKVGAKVALAARIDIAATSIDGSFGMDMRDKLEREMERLARPAPNKVTKALPRPDEGPKKRRGGKRARKAKEMYATTELRKLQNRMKFGEAEEETGAYDETMGMGMIGTSSGSVRANAGEARTKAKLSKSAKGRIASISTSGTATSGLASSLAFTPVQGLELIDPSRARAAKVAAANNAWFAEGAFTRIPKT